MNKKAVPPYIGAAYYPELWPAEEVAADIQKMHDAGVNCVRVGEFAWGRMEPEEGKFDFDWLKEVLDAMEEAGIAVILCTPTATPPKWLTDRYPETLRMYSNGKRAQFGGRCHVCKTSPVMREKNRIISQKLAEALGRHPAVIGWQLDNEIFHYDDGCFCPLCAAGFQAYLEDKYRTIENLNKSWCTGRWSLTYRSFADVIPPRHDTWNHASLFVEWIRFQDETIISYIREQAEAVRPYTDAPIGTDMMVPLELSHEKMNADLDVVQINHYERAEQLADTAFLYDHLRPLKERPFWCTETQAGWNGSFFAANGPRPQGNCYVNTWLPIAKGGEMNEYWLWRAHPSGHELAHGAVLSTAGRPYEVAGEIRRAADDFAACRAFLKNTKVRSDIAVHCSATAALNYRFAPMAEGFDYRERLLRDFWAPFKHYNVDLIETSHPLEGYKVVFSPYLSTLEGDLKERILRWVEEGGTWIVGPMSDCMTDYAAKYTDAPYSCLEEIAGVYTRYQYPLPDPAIAAQFEDGSPLTFSLCYDAYELRGAAALATYTAGRFAGFTAVAERCIGAGRVIVLGGVPDAESLRALAGVMPVAEASDNVMLVSRSGEGIEGVIAIETENERGFVELEGVYEDVVTRARAAGRLELAPYSVTVLRKAEED